MKDDLHFVFISSLRKVSYSSSIFPNKKTEERKLGHFEGECVSTTEVALGERTHQKFSSPLHLLSFLCAVQMDDFL